MSNDQVSSFDKDYSKIKALLEDQDFKKLCKDTSKFNFFEVLRSTTSEIKHSNVLAWLLNPYGNHSCGNAFLKQLLVSVIAKSGMSNLSFNRLYMMDLDRVQVHREWPSTESAFNEYDIDPDDVDPNNSKNRIDIVITIKLDTSETEKTRTMDSADEADRAQGSDKEDQTNPCKVFDKVIIAIENKIHSAEGMEQLLDYNRVLEPFENSSHIIRIFLTPEGIRPKEVDNWHACSYKQIYQVLLETLDRHRNDIQAEKRMLIEQYIELLDAYIIAQQDDNRRKKEYSKLCSDYRDLIRNIVKRGRESSSSNLKRKQSDYDELCAFLYQEYKSAFERLARHMRSNSERISQFLTEYMKGKGFNITNEGQTIYPSFRSEQLKVISKRLFDNENSVLLQFSNRLDRMALTLSFAITSEKKQTRWAFYNFMREKNPQLFNKNKDEDAFSDKNTRVRTDNLCQKKKADELVFEQEIIDYIRPRLDEYFNNEGVYQRISAFLSENLDEIYRYVKEHNS